MAAWTKLGATAQLVPMPRIVTARPVRPRVTVGTPDAPTAGPAARAGAADAAARAPPAPPAAAALRNCLRLDPPSHPPRAWSLMVHLPELVGREFRAIHAPTPRAGRA